MKPRGARYFFGQFPNVCILALKQCTGKFSNAAVKTVTGRLTGQPASLSSWIAWRDTVTKRTMGNTDNNARCVIKHCMYTCVSFRANGSINRGGRDWFPFFNVKREQEITKEEVVMSFLLLLARGAQVFRSFECRTTVPPWRPKFCQNRLIWRLISRGGLCHL